eukprot:2928101-Rhodomonas_salina.1
MDMYKVVLFCFAIDEDVIQGTNHKVSQVLAEIMRKIPLLLSQTDHPPRTAALQNRHGRLEVFPTTPLGLAYWKRLMTPSDTDCDSTCPEEIAMFVHDSLLWERLTKCIVIYEFTLCMGTKDKDMESRHTQKVQAYHALALYLQCFLQDHTVELSTYVMGITGSVLEARWEPESNLHCLRVPEIQQEYIHLLVVVAAVKALTEFLNIQCALALHSFPLSSQDSEDP